MTSIDNIKKSKTGRPSVDTEPVTLRLPRAMLESIDGFRRNAMDLPSRPEAIRRLLAAGMDVSILADALIGEIKNDHRLTKDSPRVGELISKLEKKLGDLYTAAKAKSAGG